jgi:uncharacterized membrane protein
MDLIPQSGPHLHILLNHFPSMGFVFGLGFFITALTLNNDGMKRACLVLFVILGVLSIPTYVSGAASMWALNGDPDSPRSLINHHRDAALLAFIGLGLTGCLAWIILWRLRVGRAMSNRGLYTVLGFALVTLFLMADAGHEGGFITHEEIRGPAELAATNDNVGRTVAIEEGFNSMLFAFPSMETLHFLGMAMVFGTVLFVTLRVLGLAKMVPFSAVHRLLPLGLIGLFINSVSGMILFIGDSGRYVAMPSFPHKIEALVIGTIAVLYFSLSDRLWAVKAGDDAPFTAKAVAAVTLVSWTLVVIFGRILPYTEG